MTRHERFYLVLLIIVLIGTQIMGVIGYNFGVEGRAVSYTGWAAYFIMVGFFSLISMFGGILVLLYPTVYRWIKKGRQDEADARAEAAGTSVYNFHAAPAAPIHTTVRPSTENPVQGPVSRKALRDAGVQLEHLSPSG